MVELIHAEVRRLREARGWSPATVAAHTVITGVDLGITAKNVEKLEANPGTVPKASTIEALARAFGVEPDHFYEWPIAVAQRDRASTPEAARQREADALRKRAARAQQQDEHPEDDRDTTEAPPRRKGRAS